MWSGKYDEHDAKHRLRTDNCTRDEAGSRQHGLTKLLMFHLQCVCATPTGVWMADVEKAKQELADYARDLADAVPNSPGCQADIRTHSLGIGCLRRAQGTEPGLFRS